MQTSEPIKGIDLQLRSPREQDWPVVRLLLPELFQIQGEPSVLLVTAAEKPVIRGAVGWRRGEHIVYGLRLRVIRTHRRQGIGSWLLGEVIRRAQELSDTTLMGPVDSVGEPDAVAFLEHHGFERIDSVTTVEAGIGQMRDWFSALRKRLEKRHGALPGAEFVRLPDAPRSQVAEMYSREVVHNPDMPPPGMRRALASGRLDESVIMLVDGRVEGILLWELKEDLATIHARAVSARLRRSGWANSMLMALAMERGWEAGSRRVRFDLPEGNRDTEKLIRRFGATPVKARERYQLSLESNAASPTA